MEKASNPNTLNRIRILQIVVGIIAIIISLVVLLFPNLGIDLLIFLLSLTLLIVGIERVSIGILPHIRKTSRLTNIILGALAILLGIVVIALPILGVGLLVGLLAFGLIFLGMARIVHGIYDKHASKWSRVFLIGVGILSLAVAVMVLANPLLGVFILTLLLAINLLVIGIANIIHGASGSNFISSFPSRSSDFSPPPPPPP